MIPLIVIFVSCSTSFFNMTCDSSCVHFQSVTWLLHKPVRSWCYPKVEQSVTIKPQGLNVTTKLVTLCSNSNWWTIMQRFRNDVNNAGRLLTTARSSLPCQCLLLLCLCLCSPFQPQPLSLDIALSRVVKYSYPYVSCHNNVPVRCYTVAPGHS